MAEKNSADVGLIGLAVMGQNLALNMADHGFEMAVFNRTSKVTKNFVDANRNTPGGLIACESVSELLGAVKKPRKIAILVKAGPAVDAVAKQLIEAGIRPNTVVVKAKQLPRIYDLELAMINKSSRSLERDEAHGAFSTVYAK